MSLPMKLASRLESNSTPARPRLTPGEAGAAHALATDRQAAAALLQPPASFTGRLAQHGEFANLIDQKDGRVIEAEAIRDQLRHLPDQLVGIKQRRNRAAHLGADIQLGGTLGHISHALL